MKSKLGGEVSDRVLEQLRRIFPPPGLGLLQIGLEVVQHRARLAREIAVLKPNPQFVVRNFM